MNDAERRRRLNAMTSGLARFGLVDHFSLAELVCKSEMPSEEAILRALEALSEALPTSIPASFIAESVAKDLAEPSSIDGGAPCALAPNDADLLAAIKPGRAEAPRYHAYMYRVLPEIFRGWLTNPRKEQPRSGRAKFIDIKFDNVARDGFFWEITTHHQLPAPYVVVECKNYVEDPGAPEYDQLSGRLGGAAGVFGILACRSLADRERALQYQRDPLVRNGIRILFLVDEDVATLIRARCEGRLEVVNQLLRKKLSDLSFS
jgi:hypothetical protein